jgi:fibronectin type 3 domain-containing protein
MVSPGEAGPARTIVPNDPPDFSKYEVIFNNGTGQPISREVSSIPGTGVSQELAVGNWTVSIDAYSTTESESEPVARGSTTVSVSAGSFTQVTVHLAPEMDGPDGTLAYTVDFPAGVTEAFLNLVRDGVLLFSIPSFIAKEKATMHIPSGSYDLIILLQKDGGSSIARASEKVHIYSGMVSEVEYIFTNDDFSPFSLKTLEITGIDDTLATQGSQGIEIGLVPVGTSPEQPLSEENIVAWASSNADSVTFSGTTATAELYVPRPIVKRWAGYGPYDVYLALFGASSVSYYRVLNVSFTSATTQVAFTDFSEVTRPPEEDDPGKGGGEEGPGGTEGPPTEEEPALPPTPTGLTATASGNTVTLTWNPVGGYSHRVYRLNSETGIYDPIDEYVYDSFTDSGLSAVTYYYKVTSVWRPGEGASSESPMSDFAFATVSNSLSAPTGLTAEVYGNTVTLTWNYVDGASSYRVYRSDSETGLYSLINDGYGTYFTEWILSNGTYYYKVTVVGPDNESPMSDFALATVSISLSAPTGLTAAVDGNTVTLTWNSVDGYSYRVYRSNSETGPYTRIADLGTVFGFDNCTDLVLSAGTYYYKVTSGILVEGALSESPMSNSVSATVSSSSLSAPTGLGWVNTNTVTMSWNSVSGASYYKVYRGRSPFGTYTYLTTVYSLPYSDSSATMGTYYYRVSAVSPGGDESPLSHYHLWVMIGNNNLSPPSNLQVTNITASSISLSWDSVIGASSYNIYYSADGENGYYNFLDTSSSTNYTHSGLASGEYYYMVSTVPFVIDINPESPMSNTAGATVP